MINEKFKQLDASLLWPQSARETKEKIKNNLRQKYTASDLQEANEDLMKCYLQGGKTQVESICIKESFNELAAEWGISNEWEKGTLHYCMKVENSRREILQAIKRDKAKILANTLIELNCTGEEAKEILQIALDMLVAKE